MNKQNAHLNLPLKPEDVPPGSVIRNRFCHWLIITDLLNDGIKISGREDVIDWNELRESWQIKRPGEDWKPCHKPA
jgi:hypothetical protein